MRLFFHDGEEISVRGDFRDFLDDAMYAWAENADDVDALEDYCYGHGIPMRNAGRFDVGLYSFEDWQMVYDEVMTEIVRYMSK